MAVEIDMETDLSGISSSSSERSDISEIDEHYSDITSIIQPYAFEPMIDAGDIAEHIPGDGSERHEGAVSNDSNWCRCDKCHSENREVDRVCCCDLNMPNLENETTCVSNSEEFKRICLYKSYLEVILVGLSRIRGDHLEHPTSNRPYRFAAYSGFTWWAHGKLGRYNRQVIPSCVLWAIRGLFPEESGVYVNLKPGRRD